MGRHNGFLNAEGKIYAIQKLRQMINDGHRPAPPAVRKLRPAQYIGPLKRGWWLEPRTAEELAELLARGVVIAEGVMDPEGRVGFGRSERAEPRKGVSPGRREGISVTTHERRPIVETPPQPPEPMPPQPEPPPPDGPEPPQA